MACEHSKSVPIGADDGGMRFCVECEQLVDPTGTAGADLSPAEVTRVLTWVCKESLYTHAFVRQVADAFVEHMEQHKKRQQADEELRAKQLEHMETMEGYAESEAYDRQMEYKEQQQREREDLWRRHGG